MRRLRLRAEALSNLTTDELRAMAAGDDTTTTLAETKPVYTCLVACTLDTRFGNCSRICVKP